MKRIGDRFGRPLDEFDILKMHVHAQSVACGDSYSVSLKDGTPVCGFVADPPRRVVRLTNLEFSANND